MSLGEIALQVLSRWTITNASFLRKAFRGVRGDLLTSSDCLVDFLFEPAYKVFSVILSSFSRILETEARMTGRQSFTTFMSMAGTVACLSIKRRIRFW